MLIKEPALLATLAKHSTRQVDQITISPTALALLCIYDQDANVTRSNITKLLLAIMQSETRHIGSDTVMQYSTAIPHHPFWDNENVAALE